MDQKKIRCFKVGDGQKNKRLHKQKCIKILFKIIEYAQNVSRTSRKPEFDRKRGLCIMIPNNETVASVFFMKERVKS